MGKRKLSFEAYAILSQLSDVEKQQIRRAKFDKGLRNCLIFELKQSKGVKIKILCELFGCSRSTIVRILNFESSNLNAAQGVSGIRDRFEFFAKSFLFQLDSLKKRL